MTHGKMKRLVSVMLIAAMLLTVLPAGALAVETDAADAPKTLLYYNFQDVNSTIVNDASNNGYAGVLKNQDKGGYSIVDDSIYGTPVKALSLPGGEDGGYLEFPLGIIDGSRTALTIAAWVKLPTSTGYQRIWDFGTGTTSYMYLLSNGANAGAEGYAAAITTNGWTSEQVVHTATNFPRNKWVLTTVVMKDKVMSLYLDGKLVDTKENTLGLTDLGATTNNWLGYGQFGDDPTQGFFAEVSIYDGAMTDQQVAALFAKTDAQHVAADKAALTVPVTEATEDFNLTVSGVYGSTISWASDDAAIAINGRRATVTRPATGSADAEVTLTATIAYQEATETKTFVVTVPAERSDAGIVSYDKAHLDLGDLSGLIARISLPAEGELGSTITWETSDASVIRADGRVFRPEAGAGDGKATLTANISHGEATDTKTFEVTVLAKPEVKTIESCQQIEVTTQVGTAPALPNFVEVTYSDGSTAKVRAVWPAYVTKSKYASVGTFTVAGKTQDGGFGLTANVTVVETVDTDVTLEALPFDLSDISLDGDSILTQNRGRTVAYLKLLDNDRMLYNFRNTFGQDTKGASPLGGWDAPTGLLRGHSTGHYLSALALGYASTGDVELKDKLAEMIHELRTLQLMSDGNAADFKTAGTSQNVWSTDPTTWGKGFISAYSPDQFALLEVYTPYATIWAPYYTLHKLLAGFLDAYTYTGNEEALDLAKDLGKWVYNRLSACSQEQLTRMWDMYIAGEFGGMNECMAYLYRLTKDEDYLKTAKLFDNTKFFDNLAVNYDDIAGRHANQHIPQIVGALELYQATVEAGKEERYYYNVAKNFWDMVISRYAYSIGGVGTGERFQQPYQQAANINGTENCETCAAYNMLKLTRDLYQYDPENAAYMDYYERTLYNQILASQSPVVTNSRHNGTTYMLPIGPGSTRSYGSDYNSFTCCHGTGMENHVKYQEAAYYYAGNTMYVNLYLPSSVTWEAKGIRVTQETQFPSDNTKLTVSALEGAAAEAFTMKLRVPYWAETFQVKVNGETVMERAEASSYVSLEVKAGDVIEIYTPYGYRLDTTPDTRDGATVASVMYGPWVMVARNSSQEWLHLNVSTNLNQSITTVEDAAVPTVSVNGMELKPMYDAYNYAYHAYFKVHQADDDTIYYTVRLTNTTASNGSFTLDAELVAEEGSVTITAHPKDGYEVKMLTADNAVVETTDDPNVFVIHNVQSNLNLTGSFRLSHPPIPNPYELDQFALPTAHYTSSWERVNGVNNPNWEPTRSAFGIGKGWGNWSQPTGSWAWIMYTWDVPVTLDTNLIYWYDDNGGTRVPTELRIDYLDEEGQWQDATILSEDYFKKDCYNEIKITPVTTTCLRLNLKIQSQACGIGRWKVSLAQSTADALANAIASAEAQDAKRYTLKSWTALENALTAAKALDESATDAEKEAAAKALYQAISGLSYAHADHSLTKVAAVKPACETDGNIVYYACACGRVYADAEGTQEIQLADTVLEKLGHKFENGVCVRCSEEQPVLEITRQPEDFVGAVGDSAEFTVAVNQDDVTYRWMYSNNGGKTWSVSTMTGSDTASLTMVMKAFRVGQLYKCVIADAYGSTVETEIVSLNTKTALTILENPVDSTAAVGETAVFTVKAKGEGLTYCWMYSNNGGKSWSKSTLPGCDTDSISVVYKAFRAGQMYKCVITDASGNVRESGAAGLAK